MPRLLALWVALLLMLTACGGSGGVPADPSANPSADQSADSGSGSSSGPAPGSGESTDQQEDREVGTGGTTGRSGSSRPEVVGTVAKGLEVPWGIAFLPDGSALVTERDSGRVLRVRDRGVREVGRIEETEAVGEAGLLGVAVSPTYAEDKRVFFYVTAATDNRVLRTTFRNGRLGGLRAILTGIPKAFNHDGGRMVFGPDGRLYVSTGEAGQPGLAQDRGSLGGKILRITQAGDPAPGNPDPGSPIWTWGHRNVQGLAFDAEGNLWASEFGAESFDELNLIRKGRNYGWPVVEGVGDRAGLQDPLVTWDTDDASPSGLAFVDGRLWLGALRGERLWRVRVDGDEATGEKGFFVGEYGRLRTVVTAPDGNLWVTTSNRDGRGDPAESDDRILLVRP